MWWSRIRDNRPMFQNESMALLDFAPGRFNEFREGQPNSTSLITVTAGLNRVKLPCRAVAHEFNRFARCFEHPVELTQVFRLKICVPKFFAKPEITDGKPVQ